MLIFSQNNLQTIGRKHMLLLAGDISENDVSFSKIFDPSDNKCHHGRGASLAPPIAALLSFKEVLILLSSLFLINIVLCILIKKERPVSIGC